MNLKRLNLFLLLVFCFLTTLTLSKVLTKNPRQESAVPKAEESEPRLEFPQNKGPKIDQQEVEKQYERVKYERLSKAIKGHNTREIKKITAEGLDFSLLPDGTSEELQALARKEDFQSLVAPLFQNN